MTDARERRSLSDEPRERRFFLSHGPENPRLGPEDERHALRVLRVRVGDELCGLDGRGGSWRLRVTATGRSNLELDLVPGSERRDPAPGEPGAPPSLELATAIPKGPRLEDSWARLVALGVVAWRPLICARSGPASQDLSPHRRERLERIAIEACKQSRRTWLPRVEPALTPDAWLSAQDPKSSALAVATPQAPTGLASWVRLSLTTAPRSLVKVAIGPEGGFDAEEEQAFATAGAAAVALGPHVLRIEVAAEAVCAIVGQVAFRGV